MKRVITTAAMGALLLGLLILRVPSATAQESEEGLSPISIYTLDDGNLDDSVADPALTTPTGTAFGNPTPTEDRFGNPTGALACDGVDDYVETQEDSNINPLTFSVWFRADDVSGEHSIVDSDAYGRYGHSLIIGYDDPNDPNDTPYDGSLSIQYHNGVWDTDVVIQQGEWTHVFVTYSGDKIRVYVGTMTRPTELVAERDYDTSVGFDGTPFRLCRHNPDDPQFFKGAIDDLRFFDTALTPDQIAEIDPPEDPDLTTTTTEPEPTESSVPGPRDRAVPPTPEIPSNAWGDVHIRTPDALVYDFQFMGDFLLAQSDDGNVVLQSRMTPWHVNPKVSVNTTVAMSVAGDVLEFTVVPDVGFTLNGAPTEIPSETLTLPAGGTITPATAEGEFRHDLAIDWPDGNTGVRVQIRTRPFIDVGISRQDGSLTYEGVLGDLDGDPENDMRTRDGDLVAQPAAIEQLAVFGDSWRVDADDALFSTPLAAEGVTTPTELLALDDLDETARAAAEQACQDAGITDPLALHNCVYDVAATGDDGFTESAVVQEEAVEAQPEGAPEPVVAVEGAAPAEIPIVGTTSDDDGGVSPALLVGLGALVLALIAAAVLFLRSRSTGAGPGTGPDGGPVPGPGPGTGPAPGSI